MTTTSSTHAAAVFPNPSQPWSQSLAEAVRSGAELCRELKLPVALASEAAASDFPVRELVRSSKERR